MKMEKNDENIVKHECTTDPNYKFKIIWHLVFMMVSLYLGAIYGVYLMFTSAKILTMIYGNNLKI